MGFSTRIPDRWGPECGYIGWLNSRPQICLSPGRWPLEARRSLFPDWLRLCTVMSHHCTYRRALQCTFLHNCALLIVCVFQAMVYRRADCKSHQHYPSDCNPLPPVQNSEARIGRRPSCLRASPATDEEARLHTCTTSGVRRGQTGGRESSYGSFGQGLYFCQRAEGNKKA